MKVGGDDQATLSEEEMGTVSFVYPLHAFGINIPLIKLQMFV